MEKDKRNQAEQYEKKCESMGELNISQEEIEQAEQIISTERVKERAKEKVREHKNVGLSLEKKRSVKIGLKRKKMLVLAATLLFGGTTIASSMGNFEAIFGVGNTPDEERIQPIAQSVSDGGVTMTVEEIYLSGDQIMTVLKFVNDDGSPFPEEVELGRLVSVQNSEGGSSTNPYAFNLYGWGKEWDISEDNKEITFIFTEEQAMKNVLDEDILGHSYYLKAENMVIRENIEKITQIDWKNIYKNTYYSTKLDAYLSSREEIKTVMDEVVEDLYKEFSKVVEEPLELQLLEDLPNVHLQGVIQVNDLHCLVIQEKSVEEWEENDFIRLEIVNLSRGIVYTPDYVKTVGARDLNSGERTSIIGFRNYGNLEKERHEDYAVKLSYIDIEVVVEGVWESTITIEKKDEEWYEQINALTESDNKVYKLEDVNITSTGVRVGASIIEDKNTFIDQTIDKLEDVNIQIYHTDGEKTSVEGGWPSPGGIGSNKHYYYFSPIDSTETQSEIFIDMDRVEKVELITSNGESIIIEK